MVEVRRAESKDVPGILALQTASYPTLSKFAAWREGHLVEHQKRFPDGQLVAVERKRIVGFSASFITLSENVRRPHTFRDVTVHGTFAGHDPSGDTLYGAEIMVHPDFRSRGIGRKLYEARFELAKRLGLRYFVAGGRLPGYAEVQDQMTVEEYVRSVVEGGRTDRVLTAQLRVGLRVEGVLRDYLTDPKSANHAALLIWENPAAGKRSGSGSGAARASSVRVR